MGLIGALLVALMGAVLLVYGYAIFRILLPIFGFIMGLILGFALVPPEQWLLVLLVSVVLALILGALAFAAWSVVLAISGAVFGAGLGFGLGVALGGLGYVFALIGAVVFGLLFFRFRDLAVILITALNGAWMIVTAVAAIFNRQDLVDQTRLALTSEVPASPNWIVLILVAVVAIAGILIQQRMFGGRNTYSFDV
jgi:hypothetical protein